MENYFLYVLGALFVSQFFAPVLARKINSRFMTLDQKMESSTSGAILNITSFWREASSINGKLKDKIITKYLYIYYSWWAITTITFIGYMNKHRHPHFKNA